MEGVAWLPGHQQHVVYSLAHADDLIARAGQAVLNYTRRDTLELENVQAGGRAEIRVIGVAPLPEAIARLASDALNQLRSVLEHIVYAEIMHTASSPVTARAARKIEIPAKTTTSDYLKWARDGPRRELAPLQPGAPLHRRIGDLQPLHRRDAQAHPLCVLVEHTNWSKHRTPSVAATLLGAVKLDRPAEGVVIPDVPDRPIEVGDVLVTSPVDLTVPLSVWPKISIQRPHTGTWHILLHELRDLEWWVREVAVPILITGTSQVPKLPPHLDTTVGYAGIEAALAAAGPEAAATRIDRAIAAGTAREDLPAIIGAHREARQHAAAIDRWAAHLSDAEALNKLTSLQTADPRELFAMVQTMIDEVLGGTEK